MKGELIDLQGQRFGRLTVVARSGKDEHRNATWLCRCDCGNESVVRGTALIAGKSASCGCTRRNKTDAAKADERPCTGIICDATKCSAACGWHPKEQARRKHMISSGAMKRNKDGHYGLVIKRRKTNVNAD